MKRTTLKRALAGAATAATLTAVYAVAHGAPLRESTPGGLPHDASEYGHHIDWLLHITGVFTIILFVIMCIWMLYAVSKHNKDHVAEYDHGLAKSQVKHALMLSAVIFLVVDGNLWVDSTLDVNQVFWNHAKAEAHPEALRVEVNAHQWAWDFRYPGKDKKFETPQDDIVQMNELVVPVDTPVLLQLASTDVIHSFYLPNMRVKIDATPGMTNRLWFQAKKVGEYDIGCAQHCGMAHYKMKGLLRVLSKEDFKAWLADAEASAGKYYNPDDALAHWGWKWKEL